MRLFNLQYSLATSRVEQTGDQGELHGRACVRKNRIEGRVSVHSSTPLFLPKSKHTHNNNNNKLPKDWLIA